MSLEPSHIAIVNPQTSGIAGDMFLGALIELGAKKSTLKQLEIIPSLIEDCERLDITIKEESRGVIHGTKVETEIEEISHHVTGKEAKKRVITVSKELGVDEPSVNFAIQTLKKILKAEATVHNTPSDTVLLHETGSVDTIVDVLGTAMLLKDLNGKKRRWYSLPVSVGGGMIETSHGRLTSPAPATLELLRAAEIPFRGGPVNSELATPTGVALLAQIIEEAIDFYPLAQPEKIGYGLGSKKFKEIPNVLQIVLGFSSETVTEATYVLETNLDDVTGEELSATMDALLREVALDVTLTPTTMKKSRPAVVLRAITPKEKIQDAAKIIMNETGSLGVRFYPVRRYKAKRKLKEIKIDIEGREFCCPVKISYLGGKILKIKAEYDPLEKISRQVDLPLRKVKKMVEEKARMNVRD
ncbi:MAG: nickel pincer cofactor biosynthesis protein LarC [Candidatus Korarchaeota archaeon]|nr:nickel pincer cofactor biosynthesis protein LarC [Candidatus Korarchaeota archaeon]NIU81882.1 nickel pincer cofactor biosynthesis protein LarC [Candidatus Thorarchaeota archaeon]NIW12335.1 nickel pincer cofactor biosynthesis protein LarC [Candidatus Thorarchaeota archaeon]NIW50612.1 nickel pincer cofactor biosynthesis protein LarC [Candidatus Korarchaeota archaeon]